MTDRTAFAARILSQPDADLGRYISMLALDFDAEMLKRTERGATDAWFRFMGMTGHSRISIDDAARVWALAVLPPEAAWADAEEALN
jgi:hypothetical protein